MRERAGVPGFEPGQIEPESIVLPLHYTPLVYYFISYLFNINIKIKI